ncbi:MAG TPA: hypothetical protein DCE42_05225 [Myxococcales bacterium]|nr:hypothetical protein [Deltaproteobacteria bacterium]MBK07351.1 hypothetical protein [Deltaproteobacteria bacterium]MBU53524.1 hypothetical protein [Deltaproteobacteria bacterium]HAA54133.1 hypothetical protein [Myxococcales bacterium]|tara:strand:- start:7733 stop:8233 length:501 start_codon:yes stop_codon:yes gene_type:complete
MGIEIIQEGNLNLLEHVAKKMPAFLKSRGKKIQEKVAKRFLKELKRNWRNKKLGLAPLSAAYLAHKKREGLDRRILLATRELIGSLQVQRLEESGAHVVAPPKGQRHTSTGILLEDLLKVIEFGSPSRNIPPRPILRKTAEAVKEELIKLIKEEFEKEAREYFEGK